MSTTVSAPRARTTISWGLLDQFVSSGTTFLFIVLAAKNVSAPELGAIALVFEFYLISVFVARGMAADPLLSRFSGLSRSALQDPVRAAAVTSILVGVGVGALLGIASLAADGPMREVLLVAALTLPGLALQDFVRAALIVQGRVRATFCNDALWAVALIPATGIAVMAGPSAATILGAWAVTGCLAGLVGLLQLRAAPAAPTVVRPWLRETRSVWPYYLADNLLFQLASSALMFVTSATLGLAAMAGFRVAMTIYAPLSLVGRGIVNVSVAMLARHRDDPELVRSRALRISLALTPLAIGWGVLTLLVPTSLGVAMFGQSWHEAEPIVFLASFVCASGLFGTGAVVGLRSLSAGRHTLVGRIVISLGATAAAAIGGVAGGVHGLFVALAIAFPVQMVFWWFLLRHAAATTAAENQAKAST